MVDKLSVTTQKKQLRKKFLQQRQHLPQSQWHSKSENICQHLLTSSLVQEAQVILAYWSFRQEPDLSYLYRHYQCLWGLPRCHQHNLCWHQWRWGEILTPGNYGVSEPLATAPLIHPDQVDLILVPALACDTNGYRLGYGGGYYDRMLSNLIWQDIPTIGIIFDFAYVSELVREEWDQSLDYVCTDQGLSRC